RVGPHRHHTTQRSRIRDDESGGRPTTTTEGNPMTRRSLQLMALGGAVVPLVAFSLGGWAVITVDDLPEHAVVGQPLTLSFAVRQHGVSLLAGLRPSVTARSGATELAVPAVGTTVAGTYRAAVTLPRAGEWTITVHSGFGDGATTLMPLSAVASTAAAPRPLAAPDRGLRLFVAKGCVTCHVHGETRAWSSIAVGPELTGRRYVA